MRKKIIIGNWKMNMNIEETKEHLQKLKDMVSGINQSDIGVCVPFTSLQAAYSTIKDTNIMLGAQNLYYEDKGAYTGEISPDMLLSIGAKLVILGHSERRNIFNEDNELISKKVSKAISKGLTPILCIGENLNQRENNKTNEVLEDQLRGCLKDVQKQDTKSLLIAYEPVWAIGTGKTATKQMARDAHSFVRSILKDIFDDQTSQHIRILYGGSMKPSNANELLSSPEIDGGLIGGASLVPEDFTSIIKASI